MSQTIDEGFAKLEEIQAKLQQDGTIYKAFTADPATAPTGGDMDANWPMFQGNSSRSKFYLSSATTWPCLASGSVLISMTQRPHTLLPSSSRTQRNSAFFMFIPTVMPAARRRLYGTTIKTRCIGHCISVL